MGVKRYWTLGDGFVVGASAAVLSLIGLWIANLSHTYLEVSHVTQPCQGHHQAGSCELIPLPYFVTTWPCSAWMVVICAALFGIWLAASTWLLRWMNSRRASG